MKTVKKAKRAALIIVLVTIGIAIALSSCTHRVCPTYASHPAYHNFR